jgi:methylated-DNA-[protein]-cysteine S-methyltransferase
VLLDSAQLAYTSIDSPIGELLLVGDGDALHRLHMQHGRHPIAPAPHWRRAREPFAGVSAQLGEYFAGERTAFDVALALHGSPFERRVWRALQEIPYGATTSYGELARRIGHPTAARAVGLANGRNPVAVIVPCHRVIGADGTLTGYGGGLERKRLLLDLEAPARGERQLQLRRV